jgi:hypothetical protein
MEKHKKEFNESLEKEIKQSKEKKAMTKVLEKTK